jgi:hypothetical protein
MFLCPFTELCWLPLASSMLTLYGFKKQCLTMSLESTSAPWASNKCTMAVLPSWAAMWRGVRSTFVLASRDIPARRSTSAVATWPYWAAKWSGLVPSCQQTGHVNTYFPKRSHNNFMYFSLNFLVLFCLQHGFCFYLLLSSPISVSSWAVTYIKFKVRKTLNSRKLKLGMKNMETKHTVQENP